jgi:hypothetical protein
MCYRSYLPRAAPGFVVPKLVVPGFVVPKLVVPGFVVPKLVVPKLVVPKSAVPKLAVPAAAYTIPPITAVASISTRARSSSNADTTTSVIAG